MVVVLLLLLDGIVDNDRIQIADGVVLLLLRLDVSSGLSGCFLPRWLHRRWTLIVGNFVRFLEMDRTPECHRSPCADLCSLIFDQWNWIVLVGRENQTIARKSKSGFCVVEQIRVPSCPYERSKLVGQHDWTSERTNTHTHTHRHTRTGARWWMLVGGTCWSAHCTLGYSGWTYDWKGSTSTVQLGPVTI